MTLTPPRPTHPRPILARQDWVDLCGRWSFCFDDDDRGLADGWHSTDAPFDRAIVVPYPPESKLSEIHAPEEHPVVWYRRTVALQRPDAAARTVLHFGAVDYRATVWVNGRQAVEHEGGHTPFSADITDLLDPGDSQVIVVRAEDRMTDLEQPRGKQDWQPEPHAIWYHRTTGIWQPVWLETVGSERVLNLQWSPRLEHAAVTVDARLSRPPTSDTWLDVRLTCDGRLLAEQQIRCLDPSPSADITIVAARNDQDLDRLLWSPENPVLIEATVQLRQGDQTLDTVSSYFGYRSVGVDRGRFLLNGRPYFLRMVLEQGYWPESHLAAPSEEAIANEVRLVKELGFNGVRIHQKVEDPRFLSWCDRLGLVVWDEMPSAYAFSGTSATRITREWLDVVQRDRSHPCVVAWVPFNESWGVRWISSRSDQAALATGLYHLTRALDPTRPIISNDGWEHTTSDIIGVHDYASTGAELDRRYGRPGAVRSTIEGWGAGGARPLVGDDEPTGQPVMITEFGGIGFVCDDASNQFVYSTARDTEDFLARLADLVGALDHGGGVAGFCYTQLTDTEQEVNGLLTAERRHKLPAERVRQIVTGHRTERTDP